MYFLSCLASRWAPSNHYCLSCVTIAIGDRLVLSRSKCVLFCALVHSSFHTLNLRGITCGIKLSCRNHSRLEDYCITTAFIPYTCYKFITHVEAPNNRLLGLERKGLIQRWNLASNRASERLRCLASVALIRWAAAGRLFMVETLLYVVMRAIVLVE